MEEITITKEEYEELLAYRQAFLDQSSLQRKKGKAYEKYKDYTNKEAFLQSRYKDVYRIMNEQYEEYKNVLKHKV